MKELQLKNFFFLTIAGIINACGVTIFLFPVKLYDSGISGLSMLLDQMHRQMYVSDSIYDDADRLTPYATAGRYPS